jgi:glutamate racemase
MEPALKPATERTRTRSIGVIATPATFQGELFCNLVRRYTDEVCVLSQACPGLVDAVEAGALDTNETAALLETYLSPMIQAEVDQLVLGCTHYPFLRQAIEQIMGPGTSIIDPAPSVARQVAWVVQQREGISRSALSNVAVQEHARHLFYTTGDVRHFRGMIERLLCEPPNSCKEVRAIEWQANRLESAHAP